MHNSGRERVNEGLIPSLEGPQGWLETAAVLQALGCAKRCCGEPGSSGEEREREKNGM